MEYRSRTFRIDDEVWEAVQKHELSANQLLRRALGLSGEKLLSEPDGPRDLIPPRGGALGTITVEGKSATVNLTTPRGIRPKGDTKR